MSKSILRIIYEKLTGWEVSTFLRSTQEFQSKYLTVHVLRQISDVDSSLIPTYPRFTIYELGKEKDEQLIFDSSDFEVVNYAFQIFESFNGRSISIGKHIVFRGTDYFVEGVKVDLLGVFDDYSVKSPLGHRHSDIYEGKDVPYNIQIIIRVRQS